MVPARLRKILVKLRVVPDTEVFDPRKMRSLHIHPYVFAKRDDNRYGVRLLAAFEVEKDGDRLLLRRGDKEYAFKMADEDTNADHLIRAIKTLAPDRFSPKREIDLTVLNDEDEKAELYLSPNIYISRDPGERTIVRRLDLPLDVIVREQYKKDEEGEREPIADGRAVVYNNELYEPKKIDVRRTEIVCERRGIGSRYRISAKDLPLVIDR